MDSYQQEKYEFTLNLEVDLKNILSIDIKPLIDSFAIEIQVHEDDNISLEVVFYEDFFLTDIQRILKRIQALNFNSVPYLRLKDIDLFSGKILSLFDEIKTLVRGDENFNKRQTELRDKLKNIYEKLDSFATGLFVFELLDENIIKKRENKLSELIKTAEKSEKLTKERGENYLKDAKRIVDEIKVASSQVAVIKHAQLFKDESEYHSKMSNRWLGAILTLLIMISIATVFAFLYFKEAKITDQNEMINYTITKILILTVLFYGLSICIRNYKAHQHNSIINKHRFNALQTFELFSKSTSSKDVQDAVLMEVCRTIFANQPTGYINTENDNDSPNKIIEIIKSTTSQK